MFRRGDVMLAVLCGLAGCVFPASEPTGIEFSWRFFESNVADGEEMTRVRSCSGANVGTVSMEIVDDDSIARQGFFRFPCEDGYQALTQLQTEPSDAFVELRSGDYTMTARAIDPDALDTDAELVDSRAVEVRDRQVTTEAWELIRAPRELTLEIRGAGSCETVALALYYDDPTDQLPEWQPEGEDEDPVLLYRENLASEDGLLALAGQSTACAESLNGPHVIPGVDIGTYRLEVTVNAVACAVPVTIGGSAANVPLDLAQLPCGG